MGFAWYDDLSYRSTKSHPSANVMSHPIDGWPDEDEERDDAGEVRPYRVLRGLPTYGPLARGFACANVGTLPQQSFVVRFFPKDGNSWVGNFGHGVGRVNGVFTFSASENLLVVSRGQAYVIDPHSQSLVASAAGDIQKVLEISEIDAVVGATYSHVLAIGPNGVLWQSREIRQDGMKIVGHGLDWRDEPQPFSIDLLTGEASGGWNY
jgi:hypothetical protein